MFLVVQSRSCGRKPHSIWSLLTPSTYKNTSPFEIRAKPYSSSIPRRRTRPVRTDESRRRPGPTRGRHVAQPPRAAAGPPGPLRRRPRLLPRIPAPPPDPVPAASPSSSPAGASPPDRRPPRLRSRLPRARLLSSTPRRRIRPLRSLPDAARVPPAGHRLCSGEELRPPCAPTPASSSPIQIHG